MATLSKKRRDSANRVCQCNLWLVTNNGGQYGREDTYLFPQAGIDAGLIIVTERGVEHDARDVLRVKYAHQLCKVAQLTIDLQYSNRRLISTEVCLHDPPLGGLFNVLYRRDIIFRNNSLCLHKKARRIWVIGASDKAMFESVAALHWGKNSTIIMNRRTVTYYSALSSKGKAACGRSNNKGMICSIHRS